MTAVSELRSWKERLGAAREEIKEKGVDYPGKGFIAIPIILVLRFALMRTIDMATAGAVYGASEKIFVPALIGTALIAMLVGFYISASIDSTVARQNAEECEQALDGIYFCEEWLVDNRQAIMKEKSANKAISDAPVVSDALVVSNAPVVSNTPIGE